MPLYEYSCKHCDQRFEALVRTSETPECPSCHGTDLERQFSTFAAHANGSSAADAMPAGLGTGAACGRCGDPRGPGACSLN